MSKNKLQRFAETAAFPNFVQHTYDARVSEYENKGKWAASFFKNNHPVVLELGCGKGEYTVGLAEKNPQINYIGIDIKGARMWRGARTALEKNLHNAGFLRTQIGMIDYFFGSNEVSEIWLTFPDPFLKNSKRNRRLTSPRFLSRYRMLLNPGGLIHLKTDNAVLFDYTLDTIRDEGHELVYSTRDLYGSGLKEDASEIQTFYESMFLAQGMKIHYLRFQLKQQQ